MIRTLDVYLHNKLTGTLLQRDDGELVFKYDGTYLDTASYGVSLSLPLQEEAHIGGKVRSFFSGLLPEETVRDRLAAYLGISGNNSFALLESVGGDCAGALALYPHGTSPEEAIDNIEVLDSVRLQEILDLIRRRPMLAGDDGYRLSLAGAQDKLAVGFRNGHVCLIKGGLPTTHILKPIIERAEDSAHNELFCMRLARAAGHEVPLSSLHYVGDSPYYLVERYDRSFEEDGTVTRIHQEDFCQALGIAPEMKYEREGGPSIVACQDLITRYTARPAVDTIKFLNIVIFNYLIGNSDAHGKNFSLLYKSSKPELAPAYDLLSTEIYPDLSVKMAMKIGGHYKPRDIYTRHFHKLVPNTKAAHSAMNQLMKRMIDKISDLSLDVKESLINKIIGVIKDRSRHFDS